MSWFSLQRPVGTNWSLNTGDLKNTKQALSQLGYYKAPPERGIDDWADSQMFDGVRAFQKDNGLKVDAFMRPGGPTEKAINTQLAASGASAPQTNSPGAVERIQGAADAVGQSVGAAGDMLGNYLDMRGADWKNSDKYFHCKANCEASRRGNAGAATAESISDAREWLDQVVKGNSPQDSEADQEANRTGRAAGRQGGQTCSVACEQYRPRGLPRRY